MRWGVRAAPGLLGAMAACVVILAALIGLQVLANALDWNPLATWTRDLPLLGDALTLNRLLDLQWHLLALVALLPAGLVWLRDGHVRVDVMQARLPPRGKAIVDLTGNLLFALPFFAMILPAAWSFALRAWRVDERSANFGLNDLWLVKSAVVAGLALLAAAVLWESVVLLARLARR